MQSRRLPCILDVSRDHVPRARYALSTLLAPLGLCPEWARNGEAPVGIYYGASAAAGLPEGWVRLWHNDAAEAAFASDVLPEIGYEAWDGERWPVLFRHAVRSSAVFGVGSFDLVSAAFAWLSGWMETASGRVDRHGRAGPGELEPQPSDVPAVDGYRILLTRALESAGVRVERPSWRGAGWALCPTHDIDYLRKYRPGIVYREAVEYLLLGRRERLWTKRISRFGASLRQATGPDPYRAGIYRLHEAVRRRGGSATFFFKTGGYEPYDVPSHPGTRFGSETLRTLIDGGSEIGLHPSYFASVRSDLLAREKTRLERAARCEVRSVRQHYLRYDPTRTPLAHERSGFALDSTLGFAEREGFRRGTAWPFQVFDLVESRPTGVWEFPLHVMDSTLFGYRGLDTDQAVAATRRVMDLCERVGGVCVCLWHNIIYDRVDFPGWDRHFETVLDHAREGGAAVLSLGAALEAWRAHLDRHGC